MSCTEYSVWSETKVFSYQEIFFDRVFQHRAFIVRRSKNYTLSFLYPNSSEQTYNSTESILLSNIILHKKSFNLTSNGAIPCLKNQYRKL